MPRRFRRSRGGHEHRRPVGPVTRRRWAWIVGAIVASAIVVGAVVVALEASGTSSKSAAESSRPHPSSVAPSSTDPPNTSRPTSSQARPNPPAAGAPSTADSPSSTSPHTPRPTSSSPPPKGGYFTLGAIGLWSSLPSDTSCAGKVHYSTWEPRPDNTGANHTMPDAAAVHQAFAERPISTGGNADPRWDSWLLQRVDGQFTGTTDEIFQWAACKWGLPDDLLRAVAVRESTWYQYESYPAGRPVVDWGMGDMMPSGTSGASVYCDMVARYGRDYQQDFGAGICPRTFSIAGVMSWQAPSWGQMAANQNGTFPFNRQSTAFALDYLASQLRGCYNGWEEWLSSSGGYTAGDIWGCVGAWYAGDWHSSDADGYISRVRNEMTHYTWLDTDWPHVGPSCDPRYGCPGPGRF